MALITPSRQFVLKNGNQSTNVPLVFYTGIKLTGVWFLCFEELVYLTLICKFTLEASAELWGMFFPACIIGGCSDRAKHPWKRRKKMKKRSITCANNAKCCLFEAANASNLWRADISKRCRKFACISLAAAFSFSNPSILIRRTPFTDSETMFFFFFSDFSISLNFLSGAPEIALTFRCKHNHWHQPDGFGMQMDRALSLSPHVCFPISSFSPGLMRESW